VPRPSDTYSSRSENPDLGHPVVYCGASRGCCMQRLFFFFVDGAFGVGQDFFGH
jgi:hypothetical protein